MKNKKPLTNKEGEVRELTTEDFKHFRPAAEILPSALRAKLATRKRGLPIGFGNFSSDS